MRPGEPLLLDIHNAMCALHGSRDLPVRERISFHYPGWTLFAVVTKPCVRVRFLPEQDGRLKGLWRDWVNASPDYRAAAMGALLAAAP
jgi:hypothetical protein